jgi:hypothetical protein
VNIFLTFIGRKLDFAIHGLKGHHVKFEMKIKRLNNPQASPAEYGYEIKPLESDSVDEGSALTILNAGEIRSVDVIKRPKFDVGIYGDDQGQVHQVEVGKMSADRTIKVTELGIKEVINHVSQIFFTSKLIHLKVQQTLLLDEAIFQELPHMNAIFKTIA